MTPVQQEVWAAVQDLNRAWTERNDMAALERYFHRDMVAICPTVSSRLEGKAACVEGWKAFADNNKTSSWVERDPRVTVYADGKVAVVSYYYDITFHTQGTAISLSGRDLLTLVHEDGRWQVVADHFSSAP